MSFCTAINCMDGRTQLPVIEFLKDKFGVEFVDTITEPGPVRILADQPDSAQADDAHGLPGQLRALEGLAIPLARFQ